MKYLAQLLHNQLQRMHYFNFSALKSHAGRQMKRAAGVGSDQNVAVILTDLLQNGVAQLVCHCRLCQQIAAGGTTTTCVWECPEVDAGNLAQQFGDACACSRNPPRGAGMVNQNLALQGCEA